MAGKLVLGKTLQRRIADLDPVTDDRELYHLAMEVLYGGAHFVHAVFLVTFARQAAVPSIARVLYRNGHGDIVRDPGRRNNATMTFFGEFVRLGYDTPEGRAAIDQMERIHSHFPITDEEKLYTLATIVLEPERAIDLVSGKQFTPEIHEATWHFWHGVAEQMSLGNIAHDRASFKRWMAEFEAEHYAYSKAGHEIGLALLDDWTRWFPKRLHRPAKQLLLGVMDDPLRAALGLPDPAPWAKSFMHWRGRNYLRFAPYRPVRSDRSWIKLWGKDFPAVDLGEIGYQPQPKPQPARSQIG